MTAWTSRSCALTGAILQNRAYPEFVETFVRGALATFAHFINRSVIAQIVAGSVAVNPTTVDPWATDNSAISSLLGTVEMAIEDIRYRLRLAQSATIEIVLPHWVLRSFRQDFSRRTGFDGVGLTDAQINSWFTMRGARVQWVYDWQDAFSGVATGPGADTPITTLPALVTPKQVQFLAYPAGTWVLARLDVIRLEAHLRQRQPAARTSLPSSSWRMGSSRCVHVPSEQGLHRQHLPVGCDLGSPDRGLHGHHSVTLPPSFFFLLIFFFTTAKGPGPTWAQALLPSRP